MVYRDVYALHLDFLTIACRLYISDYFYHNTIKLYPKYMTKYNRFECRENAATVDVIIEILTDFCAVKGFHVNDFIKPLIFTNFD